MADNTIFFDIYKSFYDQLVASGTSLPVLMDNDDGKGRDLSNGFIHLERGILDGDRASINGPTPKVRVTGAFTINILTEQNAGVGQGLTEASDIATYFNGTSFNGVQAYISTIGAPTFEDLTPKGVYWRTPLICKFYYDTHITIV